jgi:hypothetical protein
MSVKLSPILGIIVFCIFNLKANSSEMDGSIMLQGDLMKVFKEGVGLLMNNLWARRFSISLCGSNPTPMLQYLADVIFFWFTQTISKQIKLITSFLFFCFFYSNNFILLFFFS